MSFNVKRHALLLSAGLILAAGGAASAAPVSGALNDLPEIVTQADAIEFAVQFNGGAAPETPLTVAPTVPDSGPTALDFPTGQGGPAPATPVSYLAGDADRDGDVDGNDVAVWAVNFTGELSGGPTATKTWEQGDWDADGDVDGNDVAQWSVNFTGELGAGPTPVPLPAAAWMGLGLIGALAAKGPIRRLVER